MKFQFPYKTKRQLVKVGASSLEMEVLESLDATIDEFFQEYERTKCEELFEDLCPYFGVLWPAGLALARYVEQNKEFCRGKQILELGCGLALPSLILGKLEIPVFAMDIHPDVPVFFARNSDRNKISAVRCERADWRDRKPSCYDLILGSDILYDRQQPEALLCFLRSNLSEQGVALISDPGRPYLEGFVRTLRSDQWHVEELLFDGSFLLRIMPCDK